MATDVKYQKIADSIRLKILNGIYKKNEILPSEKKLGEKYNVSRLTIRNALELLQREGYIYIKAGKGSFVREVSSNIYEVDIAINTILDKGYNKVKLQTAKMIKPNIDLVYELKVSKNDKVIYLNWIIYQNDIPVGYDERFIPYLRGLSINEEDLTYTSLSEMILPKYHDAEFQQDVRLKGVIPSDEVREALRINKKKNDSLLLIEHKIFQHYHVLGFNRLYLLADYCSIKGEFTI